MNTPTKFMLFGIGLALATTSAVSTGALAQSQNDDQYQSENEPQFDEGIWRQPVQSEEPSSDNNEDAYRSDERDTRGHYRKRGYRAGFGRGHRRGGRFLRRYDADGNGSVSQAEFDAAMTKRFARYDINGDGTVTKQELAQSKRRRKYD